MALLFHASPCVDFRNKITNETKEHKIINLPPLIDSSHVGVFYRIFVDQIDNVDADHADTHHCLFTHPIKILEKKMLQKS